MSVLLEFAKKTIVGGLLFLVPITLLLIGIGKIISALEPLTEQFAGQILGPDVLGPIGRMLAILACLIATSFAAGLLASTIVGRKVVDVVETSLLNRVPGYAMVKNMAADSAASLARIESSSQIKAVYVRNGNGWQLGFVTEKVNQDLYAVFLPNAPSPTAGQLLFVTGDDFIDSGFSIPDAMQLLAQLGVRPVRDATRKPV